MEPYQISVSGIPLTVFPMDDGTYKVCREKEILAKLYPEITAVGIYWNGFEQISPMLAEQIGVMIYAHEV
jgi:hypothetical protein